MNNIVNDIISADHIKIISGKLFSPQFSDVTTTTVKSAAATTPSAKTINRSKYAGRSTLLTLNDASAAKIRAVGVLGKKKIVSAAPKCIINKSI